MISYLKNRVRGYLTQLLADSNQDLRTSGSTKASLRLLFNYYQEQAREGNNLRIGDTGLRVFSQFEEDGILMYIFATIGTTTKSYVDIGSADGVNSNCANFALNFGWHGLCIDGNAENIENGEAFFRDHPDTRLFPPKFVHAKVTQENTNTLITQAGFAGVVDLLSIDIDGNDYHIWENLTAIDPRVVIIETHVEFGLENIVVPYDPDYSYPGEHPQYHGASVVAMENLAKRKGYRLVGANNYGFNTIYVKNGIGEELIPGVAVESILEHPRNRDRFELFEPIRNWEYETPSHP